MRLTRKIILALVIAGLAFAAFMLWRVYANQLPGTWER